MPTEQNKIRTKLNEEMNTLKIKRSNRKGNCQRAEQFAVTKKKQFGGKYLVYSYYVENHSFVTHWTLSVTMVVTRQLSYQVQLHHVILLLIIAMR